MVSFGVDNPRTDEMILLEPFRARSSFRVEPPFTMGSSSRSNTQCELSSSSLDQAADGDQSCSICDSISCASASLISLRWDKRDKQKLLYSMQGAQQVLLNIY